MRSYTHIGIVVPTVFEQLPLLEILEQMTENVAEVEDAVLSEG